MSLSCRVDFFLWNLRTIHSIYLIGSHSCSDTICNSKNELSSKASSFWMTINYLISIRSVLIQFGSFHLGLANRLHNNFLKWRSKTNTDTDNNTANYKLDSIHDATPYWYRVSLFLYLFLSFSFHVEQMQPLQQNKRKNL